MTAAEVRALLDSYGVSREWADAFEREGGCEALALMGDEPSHFQTALVWSARDEWAVWLFRECPSAEVVHRSLRHITLTNPTAAALAVRMVVAQCGLGGVEPLPTKTAEMLAAKVVELERRNEALQAYLDNARAMKTLPSPDAGGAA